jgi:hypothetical protein
MSWQLLSDVIDARHADLRGNKGRWTWRGWLRG